VPQGTEQELRGLFWRMQAPQAPPHICAGRGKGLDSTVLMVLLLLPGRRVKEKKPLIK